MAPAGVRGGEDLVWGQVRWEGSLPSEVLSSLSVVVLKSFMADIRWNFVVVFLVLAPGDARLSDTNCLIINFLLFH